MRRLVLIATLTIWWTVWPLLGHLTGWRRSGRNVESPTLLFVAPRTSRRYQVPAVHAPPRHPSRARAADRGLVAQWAEGSLREFLLGRGQLENDALDASDTPLALTGGWDGTLRLWDLHGGSCIRVIEAHTGAVWRVSSDWASLRALSMGADNALRLWDLRSGDLIKELVAGASLECVAVDWATKRALTAHGGRLRLWDVEEGEVVGEYAGGAGPLLCMVVDWPSQRVFAALIDGAFELWDLAQGGVVKSWQGHEEQVTCLTVDWGSLQAISASHDKTVRLWDLESGVARLELTGHAEPVYSMAVHWPARRIITASGDHTMMVWDIHEDQGRLTVPKPPLWLRGHSSCVWDVAVDWPAARVLSAGGDGKLRLWHLEQAKAVTVFGSHGLPLMGVAAHWPSMRAVALGGDGILRLWDLASDGEKPIHELRGHDSAVSCADFRWC